MKSKPQPWVQRQTFWKVIRVLEPKQVFQIMEVETGLVSYQTRLFCSVTDAFQDVNFCRYYLTAQKYCITYPASVISVCQYICCARFHIIHTWKNRMFLLCLKENNLHCHSIACCPVVTSLCVLHVMSWHFIKVHLLNWYIITKSLAWLWLCVLFNNFFWVSRKVCEMVYVDSPLWETSRNFRKQLCTRVHNEGAES